jgi:hypothetical protein
MGLIFIAAGERSVACGLCNPTAARIANPRRQEILTFVRISDF